MPAFLGFSPVHGSALFLVALAVSTTAQRHDKLNGPITTPPSVQVQVYDAAISPDGARVVYVAEQETLGVRELYSVPSDGSAPAVKLNGPMIHGGNVAWSKGLEISADGARVVFLADAAVDQELQLFSVPIDASEPPVVLGVACSSPLRAFQIGPDGREGFYRGAGGLLRTSILGNSASVVLNGPLLEGTGVGAFQRAPDGRRIFYLGIQDTPSVIELYATVLVPPTR